MTIPSLRSARLVALALLATTTIASGANELPLVPYPDRVETRRGHFALGEVPVLRHSAEDAAARAIAETFVERIGAACGRRFEIATGAPRPGEIALQREKASPTASEEAYRVVVDKHRITLSAAHDAGLRHATTTLLHLVCDAQRDRIPALRIEDAPRLAWRGLMIDSARHYQSPEHLRRIVDAMALHKLNVLHWHLTDDQAWRLEIKKYPRLTEVGAWRVPAGAARRAIDPATGKAPVYGGFYTQQTARELVAYAAARGIMVVPEIEMPGHASAAIAAYPELGAQPGVVSVVPGDWGVYPNAFSLEPATFAFLEDVLREVIALFPAPYLHVGGDEVEADQWKASRAGRELAAKLGSDEGMALQASFTERIAAFVEKNDRRLVGWDEILTPGLARNAVVMSWRGVEGALKAAEQGHETILSPWPTLYFDNRQSVAPDEPPGRIRLVSLRDVYDFDPVPAEMSEDARRRVLGLQGNVWVEHIRTEARVDHMAFPRALAVAERSWSKEKHEWPDFARRVAAQLPLHAKLGVQASDALQAVEFAVEPVAGEARVRVALSTQAGLGEIRYTIDGSAPGPNSTRYAGQALDLALPVTLRATSFIDGVAAASVRERRLDRASLLSRGSRELTLCSDGIPLMLEDDAPLQGERAVFAFDIMNPCWRWPALDARGATALEVDVGQVPFNFQIGKARDAIKFPPPRNSVGELLVFEGECEGEPWLRLPLEPAIRNEAVSSLRAEFPPRAKAGDVCLRFAQAELEPLWAIDRVRWVVP